MVRLKNFRADYLAKVNNLYPYKLLNIHQTIVLFIVNVLVLCASPYAHASCTSVLSHTYAFI